MDINRVAIERKAYFSFQKVLIMSLGSKRGLEAGVVLAAGSLSGIMFTSLTLMFVFHIKISFKRVFQVCK